MKQQRNRAARVQLDGGQKGTACGVECDDRVGIEGRCQHEGTAALNGFLNHVPRLAREFGHHLVFVARGATNAGPVGTLRVAVAALAVFARVLKHQSHHFGFGRGLRGRRVVAFPGFFADGHAGKTALCVANAGHLACVPIPRVCREEQLAGDGAAHVAHARAARRRQGRCAPAVLVSEAVCVFKRHDLDGPELVANLQRHRARRVQLDG